MFASNPAYVAYETLLKRLHRLIAEGKGDTDAADVVREAMDLPFRQLSKPERDRLNQLSGDLYQLQDDEVYEPVDDPAERSRERMKPGFQAAWQRNDHESILSLLRKGPDFIAPDIAAFCRSIAYEGLGHLDTALLFMQHASEKQPNNPRYKAYVLNLLIKLQRAEDALAQAYICVDDVSSEPNALIGSAFVLYNSTKGGSPEDTAPIYARMIAVLQRALKDVQPSNALTPSFIANAYVLLGYAQEALGQYSQARIAYTQALQWDQQNELATEAITILDAREEFTELGHNKPAQQPSSWREPPSNFATTRGEPHFQAEEPLSGFARAA